MTEITDAPLGPDGPRNEPPDISLGVGLAYAGDAGVTNFQVLAGILSDCNFVEGQRVLHDNHDLLAKCVLWQVNAADVTLSEEESLQLETICRDLIAKLETYSPEGYVFGENDDRYLGWWPKA